MFADLLRPDRKEAGLTVEQAAQRFGVTPATYRALEASERWPESETLTGSSRRSAGRSRSSRRWIPTSPAPGLSIAILGEPAAREFLEVLERPDEERAALIGPALHVADDPQEEVPGHLVRQLTWGVCARSAAGVRFAPMHLRPAPRSPPPDPTS
jgi:transcriptional regulator with XRE-family HTH domain